MTGPAQHSEENEFAALGLDDCDERVYLTVASQPGVPRSLLGKYLRLDQATLGSRLEKLTALELIRPLAGEPARYMASSLDAALARLAHSKLTEIERLRANVGRLSEMYRDGAVPRVRDLPLVEVIYTEPCEPDHPFSGLHQAVVRLVAQTETEIIVFDGKIGTKVDATEIDEEAPVLARGVTVRAIYRLDQMLVPGRLANLRTLARLGEDARVSVGLPHEMIIFDRRILLLPPTSNSSVSNFSGVLVRSPTFIAVSVWLFETHWRLATPVPPAPGGLRGEHDARDLAVLLASGMRDEAIAEDLGVSVKTARRRITALLSTLGVSSRFEAGAEAARRGWV